MAALMVGDQAALTSGRGSAQEGAIIQPGTRAAASGAGSGPTVILRVRENGGHHGTSLQQAEELAEDYAFLIWCSTHP